MSATLNKSAVALLAEIFAATDAAGNGWVVLSAPATKALIEGGYIEVKEDLTNENGEVAARVTDAGRAYAANGQASSDSASLESGSTTEVADAKPRKTGSFVIEDDVPMPPRSRAVGATLYPFEDLEVGKSFFVADTDVASGDAFKSLASTITTANGKYAEVVPGEFRPHKRDASKQVPVTRQTRKFEQRRMDKDGVKGTRVFRVEV